MLQDEMIQNDEEETLQKTTKQAYVYLLECSDHTTYVGATVDLEHRLRQHNKEIKGGAVATSKKVASGEIWRRVCYVQGFPDWKAALQFEWRFKQLSRKLPSRLFPLTRRFHALHQLLELDKPTSKSVPYSEWKEQPEIVWTDNRDEILFSSISKKE